MAGQHRLRSSKRSRKYEVAPYSHTAGLRHLQWTKNEMCEGAPRQSVAVQKAELTELRAHLEMEIRL